jgi:hypothetical protein
MRHRVSSQLHQGSDEAKIVLVVEHGKLVRAGVEQETGRTMSICRRRQAMPWRRSIAACAACTVLPWLRHTNCRPYSCSRCRGPACSTGWPRGAMSTCNHHDLWLACCPQHTHVTLTTTK